MRKITFHRIIGGAVVAYAMFLILFFLWLVK